MDFFIISIILRDKFTIIITSAYLEQYIKDILIQNLSFICIILLVV